MNAEVAVQIGQRQNVLAIPTAALRTQRDVGSAAQVLGLDPKEVDRQLAVQDSQAKANPQLAAAGSSRGDVRADPPRTSGRTSEGGSVAPLRAAEPPRTSSATGATAPGGSSPMAGGPGGFSLPPGVTQDQMTELRRKRTSNEPLTAQDSAVMQKLRQWREQQGGGQGGGQGFGAGQPGASGPGSAPAAGATAGGDRPQMQLPPGVTQDQVRSIFRKQMSGEQLTPQEQAIRAQVMRQFQSQGAGNGGNRRRFGEGHAYQFGGSYIVFVLRNGQPAPVRVRTGLTDMDYSEVISGLTEKDVVLLLPSASLVAQQAEMRDRMQRFAGGAMPGMQQQQARTVTPTATTTRQTPAATPPRPGPGPGGP
jgi:hypothetical protein